MAQQIYAEGGHAVAGCRGRRRGARWLRDSALFGVVGRARAQRAVRPGEQLAVKGYA